MKSIKSIFIALLALVSFSACSDHDDFDIPEASDKPEVKEEGPDYLVMLYAVGGGNLDAAIMSNIYQALDVGSSDNVKMTVQFKLSAKEQKLYPQFDGTRRLDLDDNMQLVGTMKEAVADYPIISNSYQVFAKLFSQLKSESIANSLYDMAKSDALADFISWSMKKHPNAKRTILIISGHGSGWQLARDGKQDSRANKQISRAILQDDNTKALMSLGSVVEGVKKSAGKVDLLYDDACLMSMYENLYAYADCANYLLAAVEQTPGAGGDYSKLINDLKKTGTSYAGLEATMHNFADYLVSDKWWTSGKLIGLGYGGKYHDIALYDLSKLSILTAVLNKVADTMAKKFTSDESVEPTVKGVTLGEHFSGYINYAFTNCQIAYVNDFYSLDYIPESLCPYVEADQLEEYPYVANSVYLSSLVDWMKYGESENARNAHESFPEEWAWLQRVIITQSVPSFSLTDILRILDNKLTEAGARNNPFKQLRAEMLAALKEVGHISCTIGDEKPGIDQAYELCSPGITIVPFNDAYYDKVSNTFLKDIPTYQEALGIYQQTDFDRQVGWNRVLQHIGIFPDLFSNPARNRVGK